MREVFGEEAGVAALIPATNCLDLTGIEFEHLLVTLFRRIPGFTQASCVSVPGDGGVDILAVNKAPHVGDQVAIMAKRYNPEHKVGIATVRTLMGSITYRGLTKGIIITTSGFTSAARQAGVFLAYASARGYALVDRELYLPRSWADDRDRRRQAGIPVEAEFATKPQLAQVMIGRALRDGVAFAWLTADEVCGQARWLRSWLEERGVPYVMAIRRSDTFTMPAGSSGRIRWSPLSRPGPGRRSPRAPGRTARACTPGRGSRSGTARNAAAAAGCWPAARCATPKRFRISIRPAPPATGDEVTHSPSRRSGLI